MIGFNITILLNNKMIFVMISNYEQTEDKEC